LIRIPFATANGIAFSGLAAGIFEKNLNVPLLVSMLKTYTKVNLLSTASVLTNDNEDSTITVGRTITTLRSESTAAGTDRVTADRDIEANLTLRISPHISNDNYLRLDIELLVEAFQGVGIAELPPPRTRREFVGSVTVPNGKTVVIGGLVQDNYSKSELGIPFLSDIPILGELFKSTSESNERTTLYLFVTPTIIDNFQKLEEISYERKLEISKLGGNINLLDPNFRVVGIQDQNVDFKTLESSGIMDMPSYSPVTPLGSMVEARPVEGDPARPSKASSDRSVEMPGSGSRVIRDGQVQKQ
jgi:general secretion pathway protein D